MSTMTTTQRATSAMSIAPPHNQNTAPVFEFDCLFTHDLRKKKKTWHDGCLRFHTFNRRIMVYDDSKNFIGDLHYRDTGDLQDGEELRLDKGVLVDVGRQTGQTETDLAEVLDKGRHGDDGPQSKQATPATNQQSMQRGPSMISQVRPKSLAAVLGASQGPTGRARLAFKSQYEQSYIARPQAVFEQRPAKRQRVDTDNENPPNVSKVVRAEQSDSSRPQPSLPPTLPRIPLTERREINNSKTVINISSEDEDTLSSPFSSVFDTSRRRQKGTKAMRNPPVKLDLAPKPLKPKQKPLPRLLSGIDPPDVPSRAQEMLTPAPQPVIMSPLTGPPAKRKVSEKPALAKKPAQVLSRPSTEQNVASKPTVTSERPLSKMAQGKQKESALSASSVRPARVILGPTTFLRFTPQEARPKLMYRALLPSSFVGSRPGPSKSAIGTLAAADTSVELLSAPRNRTPRRPRAQTQPEEDIFNVSCLGSIPDQPQRAPTSTRTSPKPRSPSPPRQVSSPLFCTQSPGSIVADPVVIEDDSPVPSPIKTPLPNSRTNQMRSISPESMQISPEKVATPAKTPPRPVVPLSTHQDSSPMFCTQSPRDMVPNVMVVEDDSPVPSPIRTPTPNIRDNTEPTLDDGALEDSPISVRRTEPEPEIPSPPVSRLTLMDQRLMMPPPRIAPPSPQIEKPTTPDPHLPIQPKRRPTNLPTDTEIPRPRPLRRVLSESDSPAPPHTISPPAAVIPSALSELQPRLNTKLAEPRNPFKSPAKLQRAHSDSSTAAMLQVEMQRPIGRVNVDVNVPKIVEQAKDEDTGPWSEREAYLLFEWWPEGRVRPDYGNGVVEVLEREKQGRGFGGFMHPRDAVIRDGVDI
jgi:hypothetical protein